MNQSDDGFQLRKILVLAGGHFSHDIFSSFLAVFLPLLIDKFSLSIALAGMFTVVFRSPSLLNPLLGLIFDRSHFYYPAIWGPAITAAAMSLIGAAHSYAMVCILLLLAGISASMFHVVSPVMVARAAGARVGQGMSFWMTGGETARFVGPVLGVWAISFWGFEGCYPVMFLGLLASLFLRVQFKGLHFDMAAKPKTPVSTPAQSMSRVMFPLTGIMFTVLLMTAPLAAFLPTFMVMSGKGLWQGGAALALLEGAGAIGTLTGGTLSDRLGRRRMLAAVIPLSAILMLAFLYAPDWLAIPLLVVLGFTLFSIAPIELAIVQDQCGHQRGTANGLYMGISFIITAFVTVLAGWLSDQIGMQSALAVCAMVGLLGTPFVLMLPRPDMQMQKWS
ncbi:MAG: MFS transporter [Desulfobacterales bacterium]|nr:MFS transporter [Desulfobacterales bacterium]